jgi:hypothetical protein
MEYCISEYLGLQGVATNPSMVLPISVKQSRCLIVGLMGQVHYWTVLGFEIPKFAIEFLTNHPDIWILRTNVVLVVRDYNKVRPKPRLSVSINFS